MSIEDSTEDREDENDNKRMHHEKKRQKHRRRKIRRYLPFIAAVAAGTVAAIVIIAAVFHKGLIHSDGIGIESIPEETVATETTESETEVTVDKTVYEAKKTEATKSVGDDVISEHAILIDLGTGDIIAEKDADSRISPASMTKIMTVLVAAETVGDPDDTFSMTQDITDFSYTNDCSNVGFSVGEQVPIDDLYYGTILESGADAAVGLATYTAGSQDGFVKLMNDRLKVLGLSDSAHFMNCVGIYDEDHYCTTYDMAMILEAAMNNPICQKVMSEHTYTTAKDTEHPDGITISNWFLRRIEDKDSGVNVLCAKTGFVVQSKNCAASYAEDSKGNGYICVTAGSTSAWRCIYDHVAMYKDFVGK